MNKIKNTIVISSIIGMIMFSESSLSCDSLYVSPIAISKHWSDRDYNEVHPGITLECRKSKAFMAAGRMKNSVDRDLDMVSAGVIIPAFKWVGFRLGVVAGRYETVTYDLKFIAPMVSLTIADGGDIAFDLSHIPAGGFSPVPVTMLALRLKVF